VQHSKDGAASAAWAKKPWPAMSAIVPSSAFSTFKKKPRREDWVANRSLIRLMNSSMDGFLSFPYSLFFLYSLGTLRDLYRIAK
jgi:hypothetical protein